MVVSRLVILPSSIISLKTYRVPQTIIAADKMMLIRMSLDNMATLVFRGGFFIRSLSEGSTPRLCAGGPSIIMLIHSICIGFRGLAVPISVEIEIRDRAAIEVLSWNLRKFRILRNIDFPSSMADKIVEKSSSRRITSAASLQTSVPHFPIAIPTSALFTATPSFTPSPVMATINPWLCRADTILTLCLGLCIPHPVQVLSSHGPRPDRSLLVSKQSNLIPNSESCFLGIPCEHDCPDPTLPQGSHSSRHPRSWRILHSHQAKEGQLPLLQTSRQCQDPQTFPPQLCTEPHTICWN